MKHNNCIWEFHFGIRWWFMFRVYWSDKLDNCNNCTKVLANMGCCCGGGGLVRFDFDWVSISSDDDIVVFIAMQYVLDNEPCRTPTMRGLAKRDNTTTRNVLVLLNYDGS